MRQVLRPGALGRLRGTGYRGRWEGGLGWGIHVNPWLIHVNVWQNPLQYCKIISLQLIKVNEKKFKKEIDKYLNLHKMQDTSIKIINKKNHGQVYEQKGALPTEDWHFPSTSTEIKSWPLQLLTTNSPERNSGWKSGMRHSVLWEKLAEQAFR